MEKNIFCIKGDEIIFSKFMNKLKLETLQDIALEKPDLNEPRPSFCEYVRLLQKDGECINYFLNKAEIEELACFVKYMDLEKGNKVWNKKYPNKMDAVNYAYQFTFTYCQKDKMANISQETIVKVITEHMIHGPTIRIQIDENCKSYYDPIPVVYKRWPAIDKITSKVSDNGVVTNIHTIAALGNNFTGEFKIFTDEKIINGKKKEIQVLHCNVREEEPNKYCKTYERAMGFETTLNGGPKDYTVFRAFFKNEICFSKETDTSDEGKSVELKVVEYKGNYELRESFIVDTVFKCKLGEIDALIIGFHDGNDRATLRYYSIQDLYEQYKDKVGMRLDTFNKNYFTIMEFYSKNGNKQEMEIDKGKNNNLTFYPNNWRDNMPISQRAKP